jgi:hypothetical protein
MLIRYCFCRSNDFASSCDLVMECVWMVACAVCGSSHVRCRAKPKNCCGLACVFCCVLACCLQVPNDITTTMVVCQQSHGYVFESYAVNDARCGTTELLLSLGFDNNDEIRVVRWRVFVNKCLLCCLFASTTECCRQHCCILIFHFVAFIVVARRQALNRQRLRCFGRRAR